MRGYSDSQPMIIAFIDLDRRVPPDHPLRKVKGLADEALAALSLTFDAMYAGGGRPSIPPERLLKSTLLMAFYSVRSERLFCEQLDYNLLFRWFLGAGSMRVRSRRTGSVLSRLTSPSSSSLAWSSRLAVLGC